MDANELDYEKIGLRIRETRKARNWNQGELAQRAGLKNTAHISHIETGKKKPPVATIVCIANALSVSVDWLLCDNLVQAKHIFDERIALELEDCDPVELQAILEVVKATKKAIRKTRKTKKAKT